MDRHSLMLALLLATPVQAQPQDWRLDYTNSSLRITSKQMGVSMPGSFKRFNVAARFDPARPEAGSYRIDVDVTSIDTGSADGDDEVKRPAWFDSARHPRASFVATQVNRAGQGYQAQGELTVKGQTRPASMAFSLKPMGNRNDNKWLAEGRYVIKRSTFGIGGGEWSDPAVVADEVLVDFRLALMP